jgi:NitT/TauT family transport system substrate-binding protein
MWPEYTPPAQRILAPMKRSEAILLPAAALASRAVPAAAQSSGLDTIRVGVAQDEDFAEGLYAADNGYFRQARLDPQLTTMRGGGPLTEAVISGALDVATSNTGSMSLAFTKGFPVALIFPEAIYSSASTTAAILVLKDSRVRAARDLNGKRVAVTTLSSLLHTSVRNWIDRSGGDSTSVSYLEIPLPEQVAALQRGRIDAVASVEPWITAAKNETRILGKPYDSIADRFMISGWIATKDWVAKNPDVARRFVNTMRLTAQWANRNPKATAAILSKYFGIPAATVEAMHRTSMATNLDPKLVQPVIDALAKYKVMPRSFSAADMMMTIG